MPAKGARRDDVTITIFHFFALFGALFLIFRFTFESHICVLVES